MVAPVSVPIPVIPPIPAIPPVKIRTPSSEFTLDSSYNIATPQEFQYPESPPKTADQEKIITNDEEEIEQQPGPSTRDNQNRVNFEKMRGVKKIRIVGTFVERYGSSSQTPRLAASPKQPSLLAKQQKHQMIKESSRRSRRDRTPSTETTPDKLRCSIERQQRESKPTSGE